MLRLRLTAWRALRRFLHGSTGSPVGAQVSDFVDYILARAAELCGRAALGGKMASYGFMDGACGREHDAVSRSHYQEDAYKELRLQVSPIRLGTETRQAQRPFVMMLGVLEKVVMNSDWGLADRALSWWLLVSCWGALRFDDHRGLDPEAVVYDSAGWHARPVRTKTTGSGKTVSQRDAAVDGDACLLAGPGVACDRPGGLANLDTPSTRLILAGPGWRWRGSPSRGPLRRIRGESST